MMNQSKRLLALALWLVCSIGCWQEIRYEPDLSTVSPDQSPQIQTDERDESIPSAGSSENAEDSATSPKADELLAGRAENPAPVEPEPELEQEQAAPVASRAPLDMSWLDDNPEPEPASEVPLATAWQLGSKWSLAVCIYGRGYGSDKYSGVYEKASEAASELVVELPTVPDDSLDEQSEQEKLDWAIRTLLTDSGPRLAQAIGADHSARHAALSELAVATHVLLLNYSPTLDNVEPTSATLTTLAQAADLPEEYWQPVVQALDQRAEFSELKSAVLKLHKQAALHLQSVSTN